MSEPHGECRQNGELILSSIDAQLEEARLLVSPIRSDSSADVVHRLIALVERLRNVLRSRDAAPRVEGWQPIETCPHRTDETRFLGGCYHKVYGWTWASCRFYTDDKYGNRTPYAVMDGGGEPTHWAAVPAAPPRETGGR